MSNLENIIDKSQSHSLAHTLILKALLENLDQEMVNKIADAVESQLNAYLAATDTTSERQVEKIHGAANSASSILGRPVSIK